MFDFSSGFTCPLETVELCTPVVIDQKPFCLQSISQVKKFITQWTHRCSTVLRSRWSLCPTACSLVMVRSVAGRRCPINTCLGAPVEGSGGVMFPGVAVLCGAAVSPRWHNLKYVTFTLHHLYFWSPLGLKRRAGFFFFDTVWLFLFFSFFFFFLLQSCSTPL